MLKTSTIFVSMLLLAACHSLNNRHDTLAVQCDINGRTQDKVLVQFTNPGGVELSREQVAQLQVQYQGMNNNQALTLTSRACVALPVGAARVKAKISGDAPLSADLVLDAAAATDTIHKVELEAPGVLIMGLKCPKSGLLAADSLDNLVDVKKSLGKLTGYKVDLALFNAQSEKVRSLFVKDVQAESLVLPSSFAIKDVGEGTYKVELSVLDSYHDKSGSEAKSQCSLTVRRNCAQDEVFDPATVSCVPKLCDNAYRVGAKWTDSLGLQRGEGRYECRLEEGKAEKVLLSHTCQGGYFKSKDSCLAAKKIAGSCALLESDEVACWGTVIGKDNYPSRKDVNLQTTMKFSEKVTKFGTNCVELESKQIHCWSIVYDENASYRFMPKEMSPKTWNEVESMGFADNADPCKGITSSGKKCEFLFTQVNGVNTIQPTPNGVANCLVDVKGDVWCNSAVVPQAQSLESSVTASSYFRIENLPMPVHQIRSQGYTACAILIDSSVMCWGDNTTGSAGVNSSAIKLENPLYALDSKGKKLTSILQLTSSVDLSNQPTLYALSKDGRVFAWGSNLEGSLANGTPGEDDEGNSLFSRFAVPILVDAVNSISPSIQ